MLCHARLFSLHMHGSCMRASSFPVLFVLLQLLLDVLAFSRVEGCSAFQAFVPSHSPATWLRRAFFSFCRLEAKTGTLKRVFAFPLCFLPLGKLYLARLAVVPFRDRERPRDVSHSGSRVQLATTVRVLIGYPARQYWRVLMYGVAP